MAKSAPVSCKTTQNPRGARPRSKPRQPPTPTRAQPTLAQLPTSQRTHLRSLFKNASSDDNARGHFAAPRPTVLAFARFKLPRRRCTKERTAADVRAGMHIGLTCACSQTNAYTERTTNHHAEALMENASRTPYPPLQKATSTYLHQSDKKVPNNYLKLPC